MLREDALALQGQLVEWRRGLHRIPETGLELPETRAYVCRALDAMGAQYRLHRTSSAVEVLISGGRPGGTIALRADMDALPIREQTGLPFAAERGAMHACGHDAHMAMLLGAVQLLLDRQESFAGNVKCLFQAGEEGYGGAHQMLEEGALESPRVDAVLGLHVTPGIPELSPGAIGLRKGSLMAGSDTFVITVTGKGGHISDTENVRNPIFAAADIAREVRRLGEACRAFPEKAVISLGVFRAGSRNNAVPDTAELQGSIRTLGRDSREYLLRELRACLDRCEAETGCTCRLELPEGNGIVYNDPALTERVTASVDALFPEGHVEIVSELMASEDISELFDARKGTYLHLGCGFGDGRELFPLHNARFQLNEDVLWRGTAALAQSALDWLADPV